MCKNLDKLIPPSFQTLVWSSFGSFFGGLIFACSPGSCHSRRTGALWVAGSWSAGWRDPPSSRCSPADAGPTSGYRLLQTTWGGGDKTKHWEASHLLSLKCVQKKKKKSRVYLTVCKFTVLHVHFAVQSSDTGIRVVVGVFTNTVWETLLKTVKNVTVKVSTNFQNQQEQYVLLRHEVYF